MPRLKKDKVIIYLPNGKGSFSADVVYNVNANGEFYCQIPENIVSYFEERKRYDGDVLCHRNKVDCLAIYATTLNALENTVKDALRAVNKPTVTTEHVIQYNIESHVSFAENPDGEVFPNAGYPDAEWRPLGENDMYGNHYASRRSQGGYSLCVGAKALTKVTTKVGDKVTVDYQTYYKDGSHHNHKNPAEKLNSWCSFNLPDNCKEIPYTDEAALFFHNIMLGMAKLSKQIQEATFDQENLLSLIESGAGNLLASPSS